MGLSFHDKPSLVEAVGSLQFAAYDVNLTTGSISKGGGLLTGPYNSNAIPELEVRGIKEKGRDDDIQTVDR